MTPASVPARPKLYHIAHVDRLASIVDDGFLWSDAEVVRQASPGSTIGMSGIKQRRRNELQLASHPGLFVGQCVPFYFCPRPVMLYLIYKKNHPDLDYRGGQDPIVHLQLDMRATVAWANEHQRRWAFTTSNAGSRYFEDYCDVDDLGEIDWAAVNAKNWQGKQEYKQAEFLVERQVSWTLIQRIGVENDTMHQRVEEALPSDGHRPSITVRPDWYY